MILLFSFILWFLLILVFSKSISEIKKESEKKKKEKRKERRGQKKKKNHERKKIKQRRKKRGIEDPGDAKEKRPRLYYSTKDDCWFALGEEFKIMFQKRHLHMEDLFLLVAGVLIYKRLSELYSVPFFPCLDTIADTLNSSPRAAVGLLD